LDSQRLSEISVAQEATLGLKKASPKRAVLAVFAAVFTSVLGFGQAVVRGLFVPAAVPSIPGVPVRPTGDPAARRLRQAQDWGEADEDADDGEQRREAAESARHGHAATDGEVPSAEVPSAEVSRGDVKLNRPPH